MQVTAISVRLGNISNLSENGTASNTTDGREETLIIPFPSCELIPHCPFQVNNLHKRSLRSKSSGNVLRRLKVLSVESKISRERDTRCSTCRRAQRFLGRQTSRGSGKGDKCNQVCISSTSMFLNNRQVLGDGCWRRIQRFQLRGCTRISSK